MRPTKTQYFASVAGATMYITAQPCLMCARAIVNAGIRRVVFQVTDRYESNGAVRLLMDAGVEVQGLDNLPAE